MPTDPRQPEPFEPGPSLAPYAFTIPDYFAHFGNRGVTRFQNPTKTVVKTDLHIGPTVPPGHRYEVPSVLRIVWQPGETHAVPKEFSRALRHRQGGTVTGHAPMLRNLDSVDDQQPVALSRSRLVED